MSRRDIPPPGGRAETGSIHRDIWEASQDACFFLRCERDAAGRIVDFLFQDLNASGAAALGLAKDRIVGRRLCEVVPITRESELFKRYVEVAESGKTLQEERELNLAEIDARWISQQVLATPDGIAVVAHDISARKLAEFGNEQASSFLRSLIDLLPLLVSVKSLRPRDFGNVVVWNKAAERITGYSASAAASGPIGVAALPDIFFANRFDGLKGDDARAGVDVQFVRADGAARQLRTAAVRLPDRYGKPEFALGIAEDVTELTEARKQLEQLANHDALTGLPNRRVYMDRLTHALERRVRTNRSVGLLMFDLDDFKGVNDRLGHPVGDALMREVANRLTHSARADDTVCRLGGDEFAIVMEGVGDDGLGEAGRLATRIINAMSTPFVLLEHTLSVSASIGISLCPVDAPDADTLIRRADKALYRAKALGKNRYQHYSAIPDATSAARLASERAPKAADLHAEERPLATVSRG